MESYQDGSFFDSRALATLSLELAWNAQSVYTKKEYRTIGLYIGNKLIHTAHIPKVHERATKLTHLKLKSPSSRISNPEVDYLTIKDLTTIGKLSIKVSTFNLREDLSRTKPVEENREQIIYYTSRDENISLEVGTPELGKHYKVIIEKGSEEGSLRAVIKEDGPCRQTHTRASTTSNSSTCLTKFKNLKANSSDQDEIKFLELVLVAKYEKAILYAIEMDNQLLGGKLILKLLKHKNDLRMNINMMNNNSLQQTPLHKAVINQNWHAYFAMLEHGANSYLCDVNSMTAIQHTHQQGMSLDAKMQIKKDLLSLN
jgi:hypothetical protein